MYVQSLLVSGGSDGLLVLWSADNALDSRELVPKLSLKVSSYSFSFYPFKFLLQFNFTKIDDFHCRCKKHN